MKRDTYSGEPPEWKGLDESTWEWSRPSKRVVFRGHSGGTFAHRVYEVSKRLKTNSTRTPRLLNGGVDRCPEDLLWGVAVDRLATLQLKIKLVNALQKHHGALQTRQNSSRLHFSVPEWIKNATSPYIGCWANQLSQNSLGFLLATEMLVFFIHLYRCPLDFGEGVKDRRKLAEAREPVLQQFYYQDTYDDRAQSRGLPSFMDGVPRGS